jgi:hypothetical protein
MQCWLSHLVKGWAVWSSLKLLTLFRSCWKFDVVAVVVVVVVEDREVDLNRDQKEDMGMIESGR